jgi:phosphoribosylaminoimidazole (AIR) synthetase
MPMLALVSRFCDSIRCGGRERREYSLRARGGIVGVFDVRQQHDEFVATVAADGIGRAHGIRQALGDGDQQLIPGCVAQGVVDVLEVVHVDEQNRETLMVPLRKGNGMRETILQQ